ncbi:MAG: HlyD family efflux transporter periplasmic adaptor subunit [Verrucomicrobiaceae bacterium]|nr:HlyD family efflux transporter periplasmic adaptor subunit [Verrucomicrobiaceae bacterium]
MKTRSAFNLKGQLPTICLAGGTGTPRIMARLLAVAFVFFLLGIWFLPWQQSVRGSGKVIAFDPLERRLNVEAPVAGQVKKLHVVEGATVKKGDVIVEIQDNDPNLLNNLRTQRDALIARRAAAAQRVDDLELQARQQEQAKGQAIDAARQRVAAERITAETAQLNYNRTRELKQPGLVSERDYELAKQIKESADANYNAAEANLKRTENEFDATIAGIRAQKGTAEADLQNATRDISSIDIQISQNQRQVVESPRDGIVLSVAATDGTYLRPGSLICVIIPETESRFVEMYLDGNDVPLVRPRQGDVPGSEVRVQFEGWPAIQFVGWPSVAVGTFGGEVVFVDAADDGNGRFRVVVAPKPDVVERDGRVEPVNWPGNRWLRQGVRANGWVLLQQVPLWKEIWRQLNGFPPVVADKEPEAKK